MAGNRPYDNSEQLDREGIPDLEAPVNQDEGIIAPGDFPKGADEFGVTAEEERRAEPIAERVTRELPDVGPDDIDLADAELGYGELGDGDPINGRIVEPGSDDLGFTDDEKDVIGTLVGDYEGALTAEESAMHITDSP